MLVLSRYKDEQLVCDLGDGRELIITVCSVRGDRVRLGVAAPDDVKVVRRELLGTEGQDRGSAGAGEIGSDRGVSADEPLAGIVASTAPGDQSRGAA